LTKLEQIVRALEDEGLDLDRAIELFQEGVESLKTARALLHDAELTVKSVVKAADGSLRGRDVD
jgi:exodeoxyribonuclease VII small subunit